MLKKIKSYNLNKKLKIFGKRGEGNEDDIRLKFGHLLFKIGREVTSVWTVLDLGVGVVRSTIYWGLL